MDNEIQEIKKIVKELAKNSVTKSDLKSELRQFATKKDLDQFATKKDLQNGLDNLLSDIVAAVDKSKADKSQVDSIERRVAELEQAL